MKRPLYFPSLSTFSPALLFPISSHNQKVRVKDLERPQEQYVYAHFPMDNCSSARHSARILPFHRIYIASRNNHPCSDITNYGYKFCNQS